MYAGGSNAPYAPDTFLAPAAAAPVAAAPGTSQPWKEADGFSFHDVLDTLNPLQHIPVVGAIYRWLTGDRPGNVAQVAGDTLFGGPIGLGTSLVSLAFREETGKEPGEAAIAALTGAGDKPAPETMVAAAAPPAADPPADPPAIDDPPPASAAASAAITAIPLAAAAAQTNAVPAAQTAPIAAAPMTAGAIQRPIPLFKSTVPPAAAPVARGQSPAEKTFLAQNATIQRATSQRPLPAGRQVTAPIPLQLTGQAMPAMRPLSVIPPRGIPAASPQPLPGSLQAPALPPSTLPGSPPIDVPKRMLDALDKYMQSHQQQQRGTQIDLSP